jgi:hypothetical protein
MTMRALSNFEPVSVKSLVAGGVLQRKCACGKNTAGGGECGACSRAHAQLQRKDAGATGDPATASDSAHGAPESVHQVLSSVGSPLEPQTLAFMESRFGQSFGHVRVHTDARAGESAEAVGAHAYTHGRHIAFGAGRYAPETVEGRRLLGHELTHVGQQSGSQAVSTPGSHAEREADENGHRLAAGQAGLRASAAPAGLLQLEEKQGDGKTKTEISGEKTGTKKGEEKDTFKAEVTVPLSDELSFGSLAFLDSLKLTASTEFIGKPPALGTISSDFKAKMALTLMKLKLENVKSEADALKKGKLSFGTTLGTSGLLTLPFNKFDPSGSLALALDAKAAATTRSLIPSGRGKLTLGASLSTGGSLTHDLTDTKSTVTPKGTTKLGLGLDYESAPSRNRLMTLGGALGDKAQVTAGVEAGASGSLTREALGGGFDLGASVGLTGKRKGVERFVKIQFKTDFTADYNRGTATTKTEAAFLGLITTGFKFGGPGDKNK